MTIKCALSLEDHGVFLNRGTIDNYCTHLRYARDPISEKNPHSYLDLLVNLKWQCRPNLNSGVNIECLPDRAAVLNVFCKQRVGITKQLTRPVHVWLKVFAITPDIAFVTDPIPSEPFTIVTAPQILYPTDSIIDHDSPAFRLHWSIPIQFGGSPTPSSSFAKFEVVAIARYDNIPPRTFNLFDKRSVTIAGYVTKSNQADLARDPSEGILKTEARNKINELSRRIESTLDPSAVRTTLPFAQDISNEIENIGGEKLQSVLGILQMDETDLRKLKLVYRRMFNKEM